MSHTKEPWSIKRHSPAGLTDVYVDHGTCQIEHIADVVVNENARRIVACVNACAGIPNGNLESGGVLETVLKERDELLAALKGAVEIAAIAHAYWDADQDVKVGKHLIALSGGLKGYDARTDAMHAAIAKAEAA